MKSIYEVLKATEIYLFGLYPEISPVLPDEIHFVTTQELEDAYPELSPKERENAVCKYGAVFLGEIGGKLKSGDIHDGRAPDYDDWTLNGDILVWYETLGIAFELSSMGIRVDEKSLLSQLEERGAATVQTSPSKKDLLEGKLPIRWAAASVSRDFACSSSKRPISARFRFRPGLRKWWKNVRRTA